MVRKIAVFSNVWNADQIGRVLSGIQEKVQEYGSDLYIFNNYVGFESEKEFNDCEYNIFNLPRLEEFDGIILVANSIAAVERNNTLVENIRNSGIPCISLETRVDDFYYIGTDNYAAMYELVEHLVAKHGCKTLNYIGGPEDNLENIEREKAFVDVLTKYGIEVDQNRIGHYNFTLTEGRKAFNKFKEFGYETPDAVVCANDDMAIGYVKTLELNGYKVPDDVFVTGFDDTFVAKGHVPGITSVGRSKEELGRKSVEQLMGMIEGRRYGKVVYVPHCFSPNSSCGCDLAPDVQRTLEKEKMQKLMHENHSRWKINVLQKSLLICQNKDSLSESVHYLLSTFGIEHCAIAVLPDFYELTVENRHENSTYPENMDVFLMKKFSGETNQKQINIRDIIPEGFSDPDKKGHVYVISPVHMKGINFGYCVLEDGLKLLVDGNLFYAISVLDAAFENLRQVQKIYELNNKLEQMYMHDYMTGLYNRFALKHYGEPLLEDNMSNNRKTLFLFVDMDKLKYINDNYGHEAGDNAIKTLANIIDEACPNESFFCLRYGGDEFLMIGTCEDNKMAADIKDAIEKKIQKYNDESDEMYTLSSSVGYFIAEVTDMDKSMDSYISRADEMMYQIKKENKR